MIAVAVQGTGQGQGLDPDHAVETMIATEGEDVAGIAEVEVAAGVESDLHGGREMINTAVDE